jgi:hypothetical protein
MKSKFLNICIGMGILFLTGGFFIRSINSANATPPSPKEFIEAGTSKIGKYMMEMYTAGSEGRRYGLIWDTETGKSISYYEVGDDWESEKAFPANPLGE